MRILWATDQLTWNAGVGKNHSSENHANTQNSQIASIKKVGRSACLRLPLSEIQGAIPVQSEQVFRPIGMRCAQQLYALREPAEVEKIHIEADETIGALRFR